MLLGDGGMKLGSEGKKQSCIGYGVKGGVVMGVDASHRSSARESHVEIADEIGL